MDSIFSSCVVFLCYSSLYTLKLHLSEIRRVLCAAIYVGIAIGKDIRVPT